MTAGQLQFPSDAEVERLGDDATIQRHYQTEAELKTLVELIADLEGVVARWATLPREEHHAFLGERDDVLADGRRLLGEAGAHASPLLGTQLADVRARWTALEPRVAALAA